MSKTAIQVRVPNELLDWLKTEADNRDVSVTRLVVRAIDDLRKNLAPVDEVLATTTDEPTR